MAARPPLLPRGPPWAKQLRRWQTTPVSPSAEARRPRRQESSPRSRPQKPGVPELLPPPVRDVPIRDVPNTASKTAINRYLVLNKLIEFRHNDDYILGLIVKEGSAESRLSVVSADGTVYGVGQRQVTIVLPGRHHSLQYLKSIQDKVDGMDVERQLRGAWTKLSGSAARPLPGSTVRSDSAAYHNISDLSKAMWGATDAASLYATHRALTLDTTYFFRIKTRPPTYQVREGSEGGRKAKLVTYSQDLKILDKLQEEAVTAKRNRFTSALKDAIAQGSCVATKEQWLSGEHADAIVHLIEFAKEEVAQPHSDALFALMDTGYELREKLETKFPAYIESMAAALRAEKKVVKRSVFRGMAVAIDNVTTSEVDDAISIETLQDGGWRVTVHVADPSALVNVGDPLVLEAAERSRTLYLPWTKMPMFPAILAEEVFSLGQAEACPAMSFVGDVTPDGRLERHEIMLTTVSATRLSYSDVDALLSGDGEGIKPAKDNAELLKLLQELDKMGRARHCYRQRNNCIEIPTLECDLRVSNLGPDQDENDIDISISVTAPHESAARSMVKEAMVLAGEMSAKWGARRNLPLLYRSQEAPMPPSPEQIQKVASSKYAVGNLWRMRMLRSTTTVDAPRRHNALGLEAYCQVTSPIRRYSDLLCHFQIKAALEGRVSPFSQPVLEAASKRIDLKMRLYSSIESSVRDHFLALYFRRHPTQEYAGDILAATSSGKALVLLTDLGIQVEADVPGMVKVGASCLWRVEVVETTGSMRWSPAELQEELSAT